ncbi:hypothetical protein N7G274_006684 [Stereocaulon virgatum]|uniref:Uncharacterized protein n=1 Tax=Stereocaulon virgatum TaxID=373712 RepID=A0ABR4A5J4_9LECA
MLVGYSCDKHLSKGTGQASDPPRLVRGDERKKLISPPSKTEPELLEEGGLRSTKPSDSRQNPPDAFVHTSKIGFSIAGPLPPSSRSSAAGSLQVSGRAPQTEDRAGSFFTAFPHANPPSAALTEQPSSSGREGKSSNPSRIQQVEIIDKSLQTNIMDGKDDTMSPHSTTIDHLQVSVSQDLPRGKNHQYAQSWLPQRWWNKSGLVLRWRPNAAQR